LRHNLIKDLFNLILANYDLNNYKTMFVIT
jgi:hypothetical protein